MLKFERGDIVVFLSNIPRLHDDAKHQIIRMTGETDIHIRTADDPNISLLRNAVHAAIAVDNNHIIEVTGGNKKNPACISKSKVDTNYYSNHLLTFIVLRRNHPDVAKEIATTAERWLQQNQGFSSRNKIYYSIPTCFEAEANEILKPIEESLVGERLQRNKHLTQMLTYPGTLFLMEQKGFICSQMVADAILVGEFNILRGREGKNVQDPISDTELQTLALKDVNYSAITPAELAYQLQEKNSEWLAIQPAVCPHNLQSEIDWYTQVREDENVECHGLKFFNPPYKMKGNKLAAAKAMSKCQDSGDNFYQEMPEDCKLAMHQGRLGVIHNRYGTLFNKSSNNIVSSSASNEVTAEQEVKQMAC